MLIKATFYRYTAMMMLVTMLVQIKTFIDNNNNFIFRLQQFQQIDDDNSIERLDELDIDSKLKYLDELNHSNNAILITGIAGFIGMQTAKKLAINLNDTKIIGIDNFNHYYNIKLKREREQILNKLNVTVIHSDVCNEYMVTQLFREYNISVVLHLAAQAGVRYSVKYPHSYIKNNIDCTVTLLEIVSKLSNIGHIKPVIVYASSSSVYGSHPPVAFKENDELHPKSVYAASKISTENLGLVYSKMYNLTMSGLRFFTVYGSYGRPDMALWTFTERLLQNKSIKLYNKGDMKRDFTHFSDICDGVISSMYYTLKYKPQNEIFNLGKGNVRTLFEFVNIITSSLSNGDGDRSKYEHLIKYVETPGGEVFYTSADLSRSNKMLNFYPKIELEAGIPEFINWYKNDWIKYRKYVNKKYLLMTTFYVNMIDPQNEFDYIKEAKSISWCVEYIKDWYETFKNVSFVDKTYQETDVVIIHDGLPYQVFNHFKDIIFINLGQFSYHNMTRKSPNDIRYFHMTHYLETEVSSDEYDIVLITDLRDVKFGQNPFKYLQPKLTKNANSIYIGSEQTNDESRDKNDVYNFWVNNRIDSCVDNGEYLNKHDLQKWIKKTRNEFAPNPGIIATTKNIMIKLLNEMVYQFNHYISQSKLGENCNFGIYTVALYQLCIKKGFCKIMNDRIFHSKFKGYQYPRNPGKYVVYHK